MIPARRSEEATEWSKVAGLGTRSMFLSFCSLLFSVLLFIRYERIVGSFILCASIPFLFFLRLAFLSWASMRAEPAVAGGVESLIN